MSVHLKKSVIKKDVHKVIKMFKEKIDECLEKKNKLSFYNSIGAREYLDCVLWILAKSGLTRIGKVDIFIEIIKQIRCESQKNIKKKNIDIKLFDGFWSSKPGPMDGYASDAEDYAHYWLGGQDLKLVEWERGKGDVLYVGFNEHRASKYWKRFLNYCENHVFPKLKIKENHRLIGLIGKTALAVFDKFKEMNNEYCIIKKTAILSRF